MGQSQNASEAVLSDRILGAGEVGLSRLTLSLGRLVVLVIEVRANDLVVPEGHWLLVVRGDVGARNAASLAVFNEAGWPAVQQGGAKVQNLDPIPDSELLKDQAGPSGRWLKIKDARVGQHAFPEAAGLASRDERACHHSET